MPIDDTKIKEILLGNNYVTEADLKTAVAAVKGTDDSIADYLLSANLINKNLLGQAIAEYFSVPFADLASNSPSRDQVLKIPEDLARKYQAVLYAEDKNGIVVATEIPKDPKIMADMKKVFPKAKITTYYALPEDIENAFIHYRKPLETRFTKILLQQKRIAPEIIDEIIEDAILYHSSDIHIEPEAKEVIIRFRIDGVLHEAGRIPKEYYDNILNRIKVQAHLRIDEHFSAQDGSIRYGREGKTADLRVSIMPTLDGEKIAIRLLSEYVRSLVLKGLGLSPGQEKILLEAAHKPFGMILVTGPTGAGKTTTLYALLKMFNSPEVNITTIEDPVEYRIEGINQIQVNNQTNLTFAYGLRSIVRHDPEIIFFGEIRDKETAEIAVNAALTGHLLLSTFHANDAATAVPRLLDMDVQPFLLASTLQIIIAQRLVRRLCDSCRYSTSVKIESLAGIIPQADKYFSDKTITLYKSKGCKVCGNTGYKGRVAVYEMILNSPEMKELILKHPSSAQIWTLARSQGAQSLFEDGLEKVKSGFTTLEEVIRVAPPEADTIYGKKPAK